MLSNTCMLDAHPFKVDRPVIAYIYIYIYIYTTILYIGPLFVLNARKVHVK